MIFRGETLAWHESESTLTISKGTGTVRLRFSQEHLGVASAFAPQTAVIFISGDEIPQDTEELTYSQDMVLGPDTFTRIPQLENERYSSIFLLILSVRPLIATRGTSLLFTLTTTDGTVSRDVRLFIDDITELQRYASPKHRLDLSLDYSLVENIHKVVKPGEIIHFGMARVLPSKNDILLHKNTTVKHVMDCSAPGSGNIDMSDPAFLLVNFFRAYFLGAGCLRAASEKVFSKRLKRVEELQEHSYCDLIAKVLMVGTDYPLALTVSDYTHFPSAKRLAVGSYELSLLVIVELFGDHAINHRDVQVGDVLCFRNLRIKAVKDGTLRAHIGETSTATIEPVVDARALLEINSRESTYWNGIKYMGGTVETLIRRSVPNADEILKRVAKTTIESPKKEKNSLSLVCFKEMTAPGLYFCEAKMKSFFPMTSQSGEQCIGVVLEDTSGSMQVVLKGCLIEAVVNAKSFSLCDTFRCMILFQGAGLESALVSVFFNDEGIWPYVSRQLPVQ